MLPLPLLVLVRRVVGGAAGVAVALALDDEPAFPGGHEAREDGGEFLGDLLEGALDGLVLALVEHLDQLLDRVL